MGHSFKEADAAIPPRVVTLALERMHLSIEWAVEISPQCAHCRSMSAMACLQQPITATDYRKIFNAVLIGKSGSRFCATASRETKRTRLPRTAMPRTKSIGLSESPENRGGTE